MNPNAIFIAICASTVFSYLPGAQADCLSANPTGQQQVHGIAKDGEHAPLENTAPPVAQPGPAVGTTTTSSNSSPDTPQKDGGRMPMGERPDVATSPQDAMSQQKGDKTAAEVANDKKC